MTDVDSTTNGVSIHDDGDPRKYRTEIPNLVYDLGLSPHAGWLYGHLKRVCGASGGKCWKATKTLAKECNMSSGKVSEARAELERHELITVIRPNNPNKTVHVTVNNIWRRNFDHYDRVHNMNTTRSYYETEEGTLREESTEPNGSVAKATSPDKDKTLAKHITDLLYDTSKERLGIIWSKDEFSYHLGRAGEVERKWDITDEELEELPGAYVDVHGFKGVKADAVEALKNIRTERNMRRVQAEKQAEREQRKKARDEQDAPYTVKYTDYTTGSEDQKARERRTDLEKEMKRTDQKRQLEQARMLVEETKESGKEPPEWMVNHIARLEKELEEGEE